MAKPITTTSSGTVFKLQGITFQNWEYYDKNVRNDWKTFLKYKQTISGGGSVTELYSEVLSQVVFAWQMQYGRNLLWTDLVEIEPDQIPIDMIAAKARGGRTVPNPFAGSPKLSKRTGKGDIIVKKWLEPLTKSKFKVPANAKIGVTINLTPRIFTLGTHGDSHAARKFISWSLQMAGNGTWLERTNDAMKTVKTRLGISGNDYVVWNDKKIENESFSPYTGYKNTGQKIDANKWNPADILVINGDGKKILLQLARNKKSLAFVNQKLIDAYKSRSIIPLSLKKLMSSGVSLAVMNTNEYYHRIVIGKTSNPTYEFTDDNKDCKINFTLETVELPKGWTYKKATNSTSSIPASAKVISSQDIRLKYMTSGSQLELEMESTDGTRYSAAKGGKMGQGNIRKVIGQTSRTGINKVKRIQNKFKDKEWQPVDSSKEKEKFDVGKPDWYSTHQFGTEEGRKSPKIQNNLGSRELHDLFAGYVWAIWDAMPQNSTSNIVLENRLKDKFGTKPAGAKTGLYDASDFWYKSRAGELGLAVAGSGGTAIQRKVIQNLYDLAASIAFTTGVSKDEREMDRNLGTQVNPGTKRIKTRFTSGPYVKVY